MTRSRTLPLLTATLIALLAAPHAGARTFAQIKASGVLRVATPGDLPPFTMHEAGRFRGYEPELLEAVAAGLGVRVEFRMAPASDLIKLLQDDQVDVAIGGLGITSTRENKVDFTVPTACAGVSVVSFDPKLQKHTDLVGKTIGVPSGSIMHSYVQKLPFEKKVNIYPSTGDVIYAVISKAVDATFAYTVMAPAAKRMFPKATFSFGPELWSVPLGMMVREDNTSTRAALNTGITRYLQTNSYAFLTAKHFSKDVRCKS
ncbi:substrate-binding periplasmic protein [Deinococcus budaensis]|uniref:Polar amino acid transport system substrate-binding protein n=1 Tax=Deinococcus budaensis TaxID=1665626 RepID=A0A7W8GCT3_9DEIO|nr:transporter substrate-binding domain-containing protein [Deinococcus budaensis]MBB5233207.1 polar amino acid transport system substrate-binding protein [Deinococcus budaensis]